MTFKDEITLSYEDFIESFHDLKFLEKFASSSFHKEKKIFEENIYEIKQDIYFATSFDAICSTYKIRKMFLIPFLIHFNILNKEIFERYQKIHVAKIVINRNISSLKSTFEIAKISSETNFDYKVENNLEYINKAKAYLAKEGISF